MNWKLNFVLEWLKSRKYAHCVSNANVLLDYPFSKIALSISTALVVLIHPEDAAYDASCVVH